MDRLAQELGHPVQHRHLNSGLGQWVGSEHRPVAWAKKPVDGFFEDANGDGTKVAVEFLGDYYHGHPRLWGTGMGPFNQSYEDLYHKTEKSLMKLHRLGYLVLYAWESDYKNRGALSSVLSICRTFDGQGLYYKQRTHA
jgi:hypothetical protein